MNTVKLDLMSKNLIIAIEEMIKDQNLAKLLSVYEKEPLNSGDIKNTDNLVLKNIFSEPFNNVVPAEQKVELRLLYANGTFESSNNVATSDLYFQIISHRELSRIIIDGDKRLREFEIMNRIVDIFKGKSYKTLGTIVFKGFEYAHIDKDYLMYTLVAEVMNL